MAIDAKKSIERVASLLKNELDKGVKRSELARDLGTTRASIGDWLNGKNPPNQASLNKLAERFEVSAAYLAGVDEVEGGPDLGSLRVALSQAQEAHRALGFAIATLEANLKTPVRAVSSAKKARRHRPLYPVLSAAEGGEEIAQAMTSEIAQRKIREAEEGGYDGSSGGTIDRHGGPSR